MKKIKKTYRINEVTVEQIQILKEEYKAKGFEMTDAQIVQRAIMHLMDFPYGRRNEND